jgi:hypothetical protein
VSFLLARAEPNAVAEQKGFSFSCGSSCTRLPLSMCDTALHERTVWDSLSDLRRPVRRSQPLGVLGRRDAVQQQRLHPLRIPACGAPSIRADLLQVLTARRRWQTGCNAAAIHQDSPVQPLYAAARALTASCTAALTPGGSLASACGDRMTCCSRLECMLSKAAQLRRP